MRQKELAECPPAFASYFNKKIHLLLQENIIASLKLGGQITIVRALITFSNNTPSGDHNSYQTL